MADEFIAQIKAKLDTSEAEKKLSELTKNEKKIKLKSEIGGKKEIDGLTDSIEKANKSTKNLDNSFKSISTAKIKYDAFKLIEEQCKNAVASVKQLNDAMTLVNMTMLDMPEFKLDDLSSQALGMAKDLSAYTKTVTDAITIYANANETVNSIIEKAQPTVLLASASNMQASKAADTIQGIINQFDLLDSDAMRVADSIEKLSSEISLDFSKGISTISEAIGASGSVMNEAGLSFEKYGAIVSATAEQTRQSGNSLGTAFKTIASRISRSKDGETSTEDIANAEKALNSIGVSVRQQDGTFRDLSETLNDLYVKWGTLNNIQKSYIAEEAAGIRNKNVFIAMMDTYGRSLELEKSALESSGTAMEINEKRVDSIDGKMQKLSATMTDMYNNAVSDDAIKGMLDFSTTVIEVVDNLGLLQGSIATIGAMGLSSMVGKISANWQSIASMLTSPTTLFAVGIGAAVSAWSAYQRSVEEAINSTKEAATAWSESNDSIQSQIDKITELRTALDSGTLSEQEAYQAKSDLFEIQQSLTESYGQQVAGIDLVNGSLREQISVLEELSQAEANKFLNENRAGIAEAEKQMTKQLGAPKTIFGDGGLFLTQLYTDGTKASDVLQEIFSKYQDFITMEDAGDGINTNVYFNGNAEDAENVLGQLMTDIRNAEDEIGGSNIFKQLDTNVTNGYNDAKDIIDEYKWWYDEAQKAKMIADEKTYKSADGQAQSAAKWIKDYAEAIDSYNQALLTGDTSKISEAATQFNAVDNAIQSLLGDSGFAEYADQVSEVRDQLNDAAIVNTNFRNALNGKDTSTIGKNISIYADTLKNLGLTDLDFKYAFETDGIQDGEDAIESLVYEAQRAGIISDTSSEQVQNLIDMLVEEGVLTSNVADGVGNTADSISSSMDSATESTQSLLSQISAIKSALSSQSTGKSIDVETFNSEELKDYQSALEYVNGTMQINAEKAESIAKAKADEKLATIATNKALQQAEYVKNAREIERLMGNYDSLTDAELSNLSALQDSQNQIIANCQQYDVMSASIREATGAYQEWLNAQNAPESGDMYDDAQSAMKAIQEGLESGKTGTAKYEAAVEFLIPDDIPKAEVSGYMDKLNRYLKDSNQGTDNFLNDAVEQGLMTVEDGFYSIVDGIKVSDFIDKLHITPEMAQAIFGELEEYDFEFNWGDESFTSINDALYQATVDADAIQARIDEINANPIKTTADYAELELLKQKLEEANQLKQELSGQRIDSFINLDQQISDAKVSLDNLYRKQDAGIPVDASEITAAQQLISDLIAQKEQLGTPTVIEIDAQIQSAQGKIQQLESQKQAALSAPYSAGTDHIVQSAQSEIDSLNSKISSLQTLRLEVESSSVDAAQKKVDTLSSTDIEDKSFSVTANAQAAINSLSTIRGYLSTINSKTIDITINRHTNNTSSGGGSPVNGTANVSGTAYASGNWGNPKTQTVLIGELGREIVVDPNTGRWQTYGDNGAEFATIPKNAIIFNHLQSESLLERGFVNGRGTIKGSAMVGGTAMVTGGGKKGINSGSNYTSSSSPDKSSTSVSKAVTKAASTVKQSLDKILESLGKYFDWIEVAVQRREEKIDLYTAKAENATTYQSKNAYISKAESETAKLISTQTQAATKYQKFADTVASKIGLSASLKKKVDNGTINIHSLSEDNKKRVEEYKQWVDKAKSAAQAVEDLKQQQKELAQTKLDNIVEQYESITGLAEAAQNTSKSLVDYLTSAGKEVNSNEIKNQLRSQMSQQNVITSNLQAQVNAYKAELANAAKVFGENSNEYRDASTKLQELNQSLYESQTAYNDLNKQLFELDLSRIQYAIDNISALSDKIKNVISLNEKRGSVITEADYTNQVKNNNSLIGMYYQDWNARKAKIAQEGWLPGSEQYQEYYEAIMKDEEAIYQLLEGNEDLKASIVSLRWKPFEDLQEKLSQSIDDFDYLRGLLNEEGFFDDNGKMTSQGYANISLLGESMYAAKKQVADYRVALEKLQEEYDNGNITLNSYNERSRDYIDTIKSSISAIEDYKDALVDLYKTQITKENDALQESITLRKEALNKKKDYYDFDRQLKSKNKDINSLKAQIAALQGVTNQASIAELARLKEQLQDATDARDELVKDHEYEIKVSGYDKLSDDAQDALDKTLSELESNSQKQQEVVNMMLENIKSSYSSAYSEIQGIISNTGLVLGNEAQSAVNKLNELANAINLANSAQLAQSNVTSSSQANGINTGTITTSTSNTNAIENAIGGDTAASIAQQTAIENARKAELERQRQAQEAEARARAEAEAAAAAKAKAEAEAAAKAKAEQDKADKLAKVKKIIASNSVKGKVNNSTYKSHGNLWKYIYDKSGKSYVNITRKNMVAIGKVLGVTGLPSDPLKITDAKKDEILKALKAVGYKKGTKRVPDDGNYWTHDGEIIFRKADNAVLTPLKAKDTVVPANFADNLYKWGAINPERVMPTFDQQPEFKNNNMSIVNHYDSLLTVNGDVSKDTLPSLEVILKKSYEYTSREWYKEGKKMGYR